MIHTVIKVERRVSTKEAPRQLAIPIKGQLHDLGARIDDMSNIEYAAEWDQKAPWVTVITGSIADLKMAYSGWPMVAQAEWEVANPPKVAP